MGTSPWLSTPSGTWRAPLCSGSSWCLALRGAAGRRPRQSLLSVASAALAWLWNAGSFATLLLPPGTLRWTVEAASFCSLSLLPAVLLHLSLEWQVPQGCGHGLSAQRGRHRHAPLRRSQPALHLHKWALWVITVGFGALTVIYAAGVLREGKATRGRTSQILASMCLLLFAVTFSHFGSGHPPQPWKELIVHHAGIPVALVILLQDYRFVFLDAFVRFLANVILAALLGLRRPAALRGPRGGERTVHPLADLRRGGSVRASDPVRLSSGIVQRWLTRACSAAAAWRARFRNCERKPRKSATKASI